MIKVSEGKYRVGDSNTLIFIRVSPGMGLGASQCQQSRVSFQQILPRPEGKDPVTIPPNLPHHEAIFLSLGEFQKIPGKVVNPIPSSQKGSQKHAPAQPHLPSAEAYEGYSQFSFTTTPPTSLVRARGLMTQPHRPHSPPLTCLT